MLFFHRPIYELDFLYTHAKGVRFRFEVPSLGDRHQIRSATYIVEDARTSPTVVSNVAPTPFKFQHTQGRHTGQPQALPHGHGTSPKIWVRTAHPKFTFLKGQLDPKIHKLHHRAPP